MSIQISHCLQPIVAAPSWSSHVSRSSLKKLFLDLVIFRSFTLSTKEADSNRVQISDGLKHSDRNLDDLDFGVESGREMLCTVTKT